MKKVAILAILAILIAPLLMAQNGKTEEAQKAADSWLAVVDKADYAGSYDKASSYFKSALTKQKWVEALNASRGNFGKLVSRKVNNAQYTTSLPGAPDGEYVVIQYDTSFENKKSSVETVAMMLDKDGQWRAAGYFIK